MRRGGVWLVSSIARTSDISASACCARATIWSRSIMRGVRIAFQHLQEQAARNADHGRRLARGRGRRPFDFGDQRELAEQRAGPGDDLAGTLSTRLSSRNEPSWMT